MPSHNANLLNVQKGGEKNTLSLHSFPNLWDQTSAAMDIC